MVTLSVFLLALWVITLCFVRCALSTQTETIQRSFNNFGNSFQQRKSPSSSSYTIDHKESIKTVDQHTIDTKIKTELSDECLQILKTENRAALINHIKEKHMQDAAFTI